MAAVDDTSPAAAVADAAEGPFSVDGGTDGRGKLRRTSSSLNFVELYRAINRTPLLRRNPSRVAIAPAEEAAPDAHHQVQPEQQQLAPDAQPHGWLVAAAAAPLPQQHRHDDVHPDWHSDATHSDGGSRTKFAASLRTASGRAPTDGAATALACASITSIRERRNTEPEISLAQKQRLAACVEVHDRFGPLFEQLRGSNKWMLFFTVLTLANAVLPALLLGIQQGAHMPPQSAAAKAANITLLCAKTVYALLLTYLRPYRNRLVQVVEVVTSWLEVLVCCGLVGLQWSLARNHSLHDSMLVCEVLVLALQVVGMLLIVVVPGLIDMRLSIRQRRYREQQPRDSSGGGSKPSSSSSGTGGCGGSGAAAAAVPAPASPAAVALGAAAAPASTSSTPTGAATGLRGYAEHARISAGGGGGGGVVGSNSSTPLSIASSNDLMHARDSRVVLGHSALTRTTGTEASPPGTATGLDGSTANRRWGGTGRDPQRMARVMALLEVMNRGGSTPTA